MAAKGPGQGMISLALKEKDKLIASYMPYVKEGGLFIPTERNFELGAEVFLLLRLMDDPTQYAITGKVVWINPKGVLGGRPAGIGVQFVGGGDTETVRKKIDTYLAGSLNKPNNPTFTM